MFNATYTVRENLILHAVTQKHLNDALTKYENLTGEDPDQTGIDPTELEFTKAALRESIAQLDDMFKDFVGNNLLP